MPLWGLLGGKGGRKKGAEESSSEDEWSAAPLNTENVRRGPIDVRRPVSSPRRSSGAKDDGGERRWAGGGRARGARRNSRRSQLRCAGLGAPAAPARPPRRHWSVQVLAVGPGAHPAAPRREIAASISIVISVRGPDCRGDASPLRTPDMGPAKASGGSPLKVPGGRRRGHRTPRWRLWRGPPTARRNAPPSQRTGPSQRTRDWRRRASSERCRRA